MSKLDKFMTQQETSIYISKSGIPMDAPRLSHLTNADQGPPFERKGHQKLFFVDDVDSWIEQEKNRQDAD